MRSLACVRGGGGFIWVSTMLAKDLIERSLDLAMFRGGGGGVLRLYVSQGNKFVLQNIVIKRFRVQTKKRES